MDLNPSEVLVERGRFVGDGMREDLVLRNLGHGPVATSVVLRVAADFADLFDVKERRVRGDLGALRITDPQHPDCFAMAAGTPRLMPRAGWVWQHDNAIVAAYPAALSSQAWAAATPVHLIRTLLRLDPCVPDGVVYFTLDWPEPCGSLEVRNHRPAGRSASLTGDNGTAHVGGLGPDIDVAPPRAAYRSRGNGSRGSATD